MANDPSVKDLLGKKKWNKERKALRDLILDCGLVETVKWKKLCYALEGNNVVIIYSKKDHCALGFIKGSLLEDPNDVLVQPGKHSQAMRQMRFESLEEIEDSEDLIREFIKKAVQAEKDGLKIDFDEKDNLDIPDELQDALEEDAELAEAFEELTPGRQRSYVLHIEDAKKSETRARRVEKARPKIMKGKGHNER